MIEYEKFQKIKSKVFKWSYKAQNLKTFVLWKLPKLRIITANRYWGKENENKIYITFWRAFKECIEIWESGSRVRYISCESCKAVGIDNKSEKYGWKYEGHHFWSCFKCKDENND